jgi:uroporphyrinogen-III synthase
MNKRHWLLTRPAGSNEKLQQLLEAQGIVCTVHPLMARTVLPASATTQQWLYDLDQIDYLISVSAFASQCFIDLAEALWPQWPVGIQSWAVGQAAAQPLIQAGFEVNCPKISTTEGLLSNLPEALTHTQVMLLKGQGGRPLLAKTLNQRGAKIKAIDFYQREPLPPPPNLASLLPKLEGVIITSAQAFQHWLLWVKGLSHWQNKHYIVPSDRVASELARANCTQIHISQGADHQAVFNTLLTLKSS